MEETTMAGKLEGKKIAIVPGGGGQRRLPARRSGRSAVRGRLRPDQQATAIEQFAAGAHEHQHEPTRAAAS
jgi:hypothetical protein